VADAQAVVETLKANAQLYSLEKGRAMPVKAAARMVANLLFSSRYIPLSLQALVAGVDESGSHIYALDPFGSVTEEKCVSTGSGSPIAYGLLESEYREDLTIEDGVNLVVRAIHSSMKRDSASGDSFDVAIITDEGYRELSDEEKMRLAQ
jgi:proteasome beta subunit